MSELLSHLKLKGGAETRRTYGSAVTHIALGDGNTRPTILLEDGRSGPGCCLACSDPPCTQRLPTQSSPIRVLAEFPQDPASDLCPTNAIHIDGSTGWATIEHDLCIGCGLCIMLCPWGAIHLRKDGRAVVSTDDPKRLVTTTTAPVVATSPLRAGRLASFRSPAFQLTEAAVHQMPDAVALRFVANLFTLLGVDARVRRRGDTNMRVDGLLGFPDGRLGIMEVELTPNVVESPRALLEDVAVLHSRYDVPLGHIYPVSVILGLPNARSEYYQVMADIDTVLHLQCRTITIGALVTLLWHATTLTHLDGLFITTAGGMDMRASMTALVGTLEGEPYSAAFVTAK